MQVKVETINPSRAKELLAQNNSNFRKLDKGRVAMYARDMRAGSWQLNGETIKLNGTQLLDGQHRLAAVIESGATIETLVVRGLEVDARTVDRGKPRLFQQQLAYLGWPHSKLCAAITKTVWEYQNGVLYTQHRTPTIEELIELAERNKAAMQSAARLAHHTRGVLPPSLSGAVILIGCEYFNPEDYEFPRWFINALDTGADLQPADPVLHLRNRLSKHKPGQRIDRTLLRAMVVKTWNKTVEGATGSASMVRIVASGPNKHKLPETIYSCINRELLTL